MRKHIVFFMVILMMLLITACKSSDSQRNENNSNIVQISNGTNTTLDITKTFDPSNLEQVEVVGVRSAFVDVIQKHKLPFKVGNITSSWSDESEVEFSFALEYDDIVKKQYLEVSMFALDKNMQRGFEVYLNPECNKEVIKNAIICSIMTISPELDYKQAENYFLQMTRNYVGEGRSEVVTVNNYKVHISKNVPLKTGNGGYRGYPVLHVVSNKDVIINEDTNKYRVVSEKMDVRDFVHITGCVVGYNDMHYPSVLRIKEDSNIWGIYYDADKFNGYIAVGQNYVFYGQFAGKRDGYDYSLKLHHINDIETKITKKFENVDNKAKNLTTDGKSDKTIVNNLSANEIKDNNQSVVSKTSGTKATVKDIDISFSKDYVDANGCHLKVFAKNNSAEIFNGDIYVTFYSRDGKKRLGSDTVMIKGLYPGNESWANVTIDAYNGIPKMAVDFSEVKFISFKKVSADVNVEATQKTRNSFKWNFEGVSWYNDVAAITVYTNGTSVVILEDNTKEQAQFYANTVLSCGKDYGVSTVQVMNNKGDILFVKGTGELIFKNIDIKTPNGINSKSTKENIGRSMGNPSFVGSTCLQIDYNDTGMPISDVTSFKGTDNVMIAGRLCGVVGKNNLVIRWTFPNGFVEESKLYYIENGETINEGRVAKEIGFGTGSVSVILESTRTVLATYNFEICK